MLGRPALKALAIESPGYYVRNELGAKRLQETEKREGPGVPLFFGFTSTKT